VVVEGATGQHIRSKCQLAFHSRVFSGRVERESWREREEEGRNSRSGTRLRFYSHRQDNRQHDQVDWRQEQPEVVRPGSPEAQVLREGRESEREVGELEEAYRRSHRTPDKTGELHQTGQTDPSPLAHRPRPKILPDRATQAVYNPTHFAKGISTDPETRPSIAHKDLSHRTSPRGCKTGQEGHISDSTL
jgi:hypothetical protein